MPRSQASLAEDLLIGSLLGLSIGCATATAVAAVTYPEAIILLIVAAPLALPLCPVYRLTARKAKWIAVRHVAFWLLAAITVFVVVGIPWLMIDPDAEEMYEAYEALDIDIEIAKVYLSVAVGAYATQILYDRLSIARPDPPRGFEVITPTATPDLTTGSREAGQVE